jgi:hypothetical protein
MEGSPVPRPIARRASVRSVSGRRPKTHHSLECVGGESGAVQHGRVLRKERAHRVDCVDPRPRCRLQPGEPYDRLQGATDLHCVCGVIRRSREKRQGRNESRTGMSGSKTHDEAAVVEKAQARSTACPASWTPRLAGTVVSREWTHTMDVDGGAIFETNPMRGVRQDFSCFARSKPRSQAATR